MKLRVYVWGVIFAAVFSWVAAFRFLPISDWRLVLPLVVALGVLSFMAEWLAFKVPFGGTVSLSFAANYAAVLLGGPLAGAAVSLIGGALTPQDIVERKPLSRILFNGAQISLAALVSGGVFLLVGGVPLLYAPEAGQVATGWLLSALLVAPIQAGVNLSLVAGAISLSSEAPFRETWIGILKLYAVSLFGLTLLGLVLAQLLAVSSIPGMLLIVVPFVVARQTFEVYRQQEEAYRETVKSLVTALEAKDPYTRGHSERVAWYARQVADEVGLTQQQVERIEWAALLHDIGKVAIKTATLTKPGRLTAEEYAQVQDHPSIAVNLLSGIDFLDDIVPLIAAHHERPDGQGYPAGIQGDALPDGARILAVADCFDAMTSTRAYRAAMDYDAAWAEMHRSSGTQLDPAYVDALRRRVDKGTLSRMLDGVANA